MTEPSCSWHEESWGRAKKAVKSQKIEPWKFAVSGGREGGDSDSPRGNTFLLAVAVVLSSHKPSWTAAGFPERFVGLAYFCTFFCVHSNQTSSIWGQNKKHWNSSVCSLPHFAPILFCVCVFSLFWWLLKIRNCTVHSSTVEYLLLWNRII